MLRIFTIVVLASLHLAHGQQPAKTTPVVIEGVTVIEVRAGLGSLSPERRAEGIRERILAVARDERIRQSDIHVELVDGAMVIVGGTNTITTVSSEDARLAQLTREDLAANYVHAIRAAMSGYRETHVRARLPVRLGWIVAVWLIAIGLLWLIRLIHSHLQARLTAWRQAVKDSEDKQKVVKLMTATKLRGVEIWAYRLVLMSAGLVLVSGAVTYTLRQFALTEEVAETWIELLKDPILTILNGLISYVPSLAFLAVWAAFIFGLLRLNRVFWRWVATGAVTIPGFFQEWADPTSKILGFLIGAFALVVAFPYLPGGNTDAFKGVSIFIGVLISLGSGSAMGNIVSGIILTYTRAFRIGDRIRVGEHVGDVMERNLLVTRLRTIKNEDIVVPNSTVVSSSVVNYSDGAKAGALIIHTTLTIGYDTPWRTVHQLLIDAALRTPGVRKTPAPFVLQTALNDYNVAYQINVYVDNAAAMADIDSDLHENIQDLFNEGGVEIMSPAYHALRDGNQTAIPPDCLPEGYRKPGFRVESS